MRKLLLLFLLTLAASANAQWGHNAGARFYWSKQGGEVKTDSIRFIAGSGTSLAQSGSTLTISSTPGAGSVDSTNIVNLSVAATDIVNGAILNAKYANGSISTNKFTTAVYPAIRRNIGWTSNGTITSDTVTARVEFGGTANAEFKVFDADNDSVIIKPQSLNPFVFKTGSTVQAAIDSNGSITAGGESGVNNSVSLEASGVEPRIDFQASDGDEVQITVTTSDQMKFDEATGGYYFEDSGIIVGSASGGQLGSGTINIAGALTAAGFTKAPDMLEFLGGALQATTSAGASDTTAKYTPMKAFSVDDSATFDISTSIRFASLDSIVIIAYSNTATSNVVFNCQIRQIQIGGVITNAFNAATSKTIATGTAGTLRQWSFTSFGSVTANVFSEIIGKIYRTTGGTGGDVFVRRVLVYGVGLR